MGIFLVILRSVILTGLISGSIAAVFLKYGFWEVFTIATAVQIVIFVIVNTVRDYKFRQVELERTKSLEKQGLGVECPCYKKIQQFVPVTLNEGNSYICDECDKRINVELTATTAMATIPMNLEQSMKNIEDIYDHVTSTAKDTE